MDNLKVAFATDDGKIFMDRHFGDAKYYYIYLINEDSAERINIIKNTSEDEDEVHADPKKAGSITKLLKLENVHIVVSKVFGPNIMRIKKKFVCIVIKENLITNSVKIVKNNFSKIIKEWEKGAGRDFLKL